MHNHFNVCMLCDWCRGFNLHDGTPMSILMHVCMIPLNTTQHTFNRTTWLSDAVPEQYNSNRSCANPDDAAMGSAKLEAATTWSRLSRVGAGGTGASTASMRETSSIVLIRQGASSRSTRDVNSAIASKCDQVSSQCRKMGSVNPESHLTTACKPQLQVKWLAQTVEMFDHVYTIESLSQQICRPYETTLSLTMLWRVCCIEARIDAARQWVAAVNITPITCRMDTKAWHCFIIDMTRWTSVPAACS